MVLADQLVVLAYLGATLWLGIRRGRSTPAPDARAGYLLAGRRLTLPAFVVTTVSTFYGGILGVGEYSFRYGLSNWLVFGVPYYLWAAVFAFAFAGRAQRARALTLPEQIRDALGRGPGAVAAVVVLATALPAAYLLTLGVLLRNVAGGPLWLCLVAATVFSVLYVWHGGFGAIVRTEFLQFALMFAGFALILGVLVARHGFLPFLTEHLPASHWTWNGGLPLSSIVVWYVISLSTLAEPTFYQHCFAARTPGVARWGLVVSIGCWLVFDALTTFTGLYARALLDLAPADATEAFPRLATAVLPPGLAGLFYVAMFATVMSTVDGYLFVAASVLGRDLLGRMPRFAGRVPAATRLGLVLAAAAALAIALQSHSVVRIWHAFGTVSTATLLFPILGAFHPRLRMSERGAVVEMLAVLAVTGGWLASRALTSDGAFFLGVEPIYVGLGLGVLLFMADRLGVWGAGPAARRGETP